MEPPLYQDEEARDTQITMVMNAAHPLCVPTWAVSEVMPPSPPPPFTWQVWKERSDRYYNHEYVDAGNDAGYIC